jgi:hypothetical protein
MKFVLGLLFALIALPALGEDLQPNVIIEWDGSARHQVFTAGDLSLAIDIEGADMDADRPATLTVMADGKAVGTTSALGSGTVFGRLGVTTLEPGGRSVVFAVYSGGAHCCMQISTITETPAGWITDETGIVDSDLISVEDIDGDGTFEIPLSDDRFNYTFDAFAFSLPPQKIIKLKDGISYDAAGEPQFRPYLEATLADARPLCSGETYELAACAGLLGTAARLGTYETELGPILKAIDAGKTTSGWTEFEFCLNADCTETKKFDRFADAIDYALRTWGYLPGKKQSSMPLRR